MIVALGVTVMNTATATVETTTTTGIDHGADGTVTTGDPTTMVHRVKPIRYKCAAQRARSRMTGVSVFAALLLGSLVVQTTTMIDSGKTDITTSVDKISATAGETRGDLVQDENLGIVEGILGDSGCLWVDLCDDIWKL